MTVKRIFWFTNSGYDVHILRGQSSDSLVGSLTLDTGDKFIAANDIDNIPTSVKRIEFLPNFKGKHNGSLYEGHGIQVFKPTGLVSALSNAPPGPALRNFLLFGVVTLDTGKVLKLPIRIHIHDSIEKLWLTPTTLTIHAGTEIADGIKLTVLARFGDKTMGDITDWDSLEWTSSDDDQIKVDKGSLQAQDAGAEARISVTHPPFPASPNLTSTSEVRSLPEWPRYAADSVKLKYLPGPGPGPKHHQEATNVLFLPEGFADSERDEFEAIVRRIVVRMRNYRTTRPLTYDLEDSINYWMAFVPSHDRGVSVLPECYVRNEHQETADGRALEVLKPSEPPKNATKWSLHNLVYEVGLSVPVDDKEDKTRLEEEGQQAVSVADGKLAEWKELYGEDSHGAEITASRVDHLYWRWLKLDNRALLNEKDTAFGLAFGQRPRFERVHLAPGDEHREAQYLDRYPRRMPREHFEQFLANLTFKGNRIGQMWADGGKDRSRVGFIARIDVGRPASGEEYFFAVLSQPVDRVNKLGSDEYHRLRRTGRGIETMPANIHPSGGDLQRITLTVAHELGHTLGLGDEYGEHTEPPDRLAEDRAAESANIQLSTDVSPLGKLDGGRIEWRWPRISAAGVLRGQPQPEDAGFRIKVGKGHASQFNPGDLVVLRKRPLVQHPEPSVFLKVMDVPASDELVVQQTGQPLDDHTRYREGDVIARPTGRDLVAPIIQAHITDTGGPLDTPAADPRRACDPQAQKILHDKRDYVIPKNLPNDLFTNPDIPRNIRTNLKNHPYFIVGLYKGGARHYCGVFHSTGVCLMNQHGRHHRGIHRYCQVCRYLLVDQIDPTKHPRIDEFYEDEYPEPTP